MGDERVAEEPRDIKLCSYSHILGFCTCLGVSARVQGAKVMSMGSQTGLERAAASVTTLLCSYVCALHSMLYMHPCTHSFRVSF